MKRPKNWKNRREKVFNRDGRVCTYCGRTEKEDSDSPYKHRRRPITMTVDHVVPVSRGGSYSIANLVPCCPWCNNHRGDTTILDWLSDLYPLQTDRGRRALDIVLRAMRSGPPNPSERVTLRQLEMVFNAPGDHRGQPTE